MTTSAELLATFERLAASMRANAAGIEQAAAAQGIPLGDLQITIDSLHAQAAQADAAAEALRNGDAVALDEVEEDTGISFGGIHVFPEEPPRA